MKWSTKRKLCVKKQKKVAKKTKSSSKTSTSGKYQPLNIPFKTGKKKTTTKSSTVKSTKIVGDAKFAPFQMNVKRNRKSSGVNKK